MTLGAFASGSGWSGSNVDPIALIPRAVTALNSVSGTSSELSASMPASSSTCVGASGSSNSTTTPQIGAIGSGRSSRVHGPAAITRGPDVGPGVPSTNRAPARFARSAHACAAAAGGTGRPVSIRRANSPGASAGSSRCGSSISSAPGCSNGCSLTSSSPTGSAGKAKPSSAR